MNDTAESSKAEADRFSGLLLDTAPAIIAYVGADERYRKANAAYQRWFGIDPQELRGKSVAEVFGASVYQSLKPRLERVLHGERVTFEEHYPNGTEAGLTLEVTYTPDIDERGGVRGFAVHGKDITARKQAQEQLLSSEGRWRGLFDRMAEGFFVGEMLYDEAGQAIDFRFLEVNRSFETLTGLHDATGRTVREMISPTPDESVRTYASVVETGIPQQFETLVPGLDNRWYEATARKTEGLQFSVLFTDITERKRTREELNTNEAQMSALIRLGDQLRDPRDISSITQAAMQVVGEALNVARAGYGVVDRSGEYLTIDNDWVSKSVDTLTGTYRFQDFGEELGKRLSQGEFIVVDNTETHPITAREAARWKALNIGAVVNLPLLENGQLSAVLFLQDSVPRQWTESELLFMHKVADRTWAAVERARVLQELENSEEFARGVLASSPDCVKILDLDGNLLSINASGCDQLEIDEPSGILAHSWRNIWKTGDSGEMERAIAGAQGGETVRFEGFCPTTRGAPKWWEVVVTPVRNSGGQPVRLLVVLRDISERREIEAERERLNLELKRSNDELAGFAHLVAHDVQSPLRSVTSFAQLLQRDADTQLSERHREFMAHIVDNAQRMQTLVEALLRFAQVGQGEIDRSAVPLDLVVDTALRNLLLQIEETNAVITRGALPTVLGDSVQLVQVFQNLIGNGLKYGRAGVSPFIGIHASRSGNELLVAVEDNGEGIAPEHLKKVFEPMKRLHGSEIPGSGLGLSVCRKIVERHGGRMWVESQPGLGSTFLFTLPGA